MAEAAKELAPPLPDPVWAAVEPLLPKRLRPELGGRPRADERRVFSAALHWLGGCPVRRAGDPFGVAKSTLHRRVRVWQAEGVWRPAVEAAKASDPEVFAVWCKRVQRWETVYGRRAPQRRAAA